VLLGGDGNRFDVAQSTSALCGELQGEQPFAGVNLSARGVYGLSFAGDFAGVQIANDNLARLRGGIDACDQWHL
jgi:hypothetical protein